jgi:monoamine oxidase
VAYDALIIGAGAAGLAALRELHRGGLNVACIEALDRIGGRIYTVHDPLSPVAIELGAEFVHGRPPEIFDLIAEAGLPVVERVHEIHRTGDAPAEPDDGGMWRLLAAMEQAAGNGPDQSFADFAAQAPFDDRAKHAATRYVEGFNAARGEIVSIQSLAQEAKAAEAIEGGRAFHLQEGYDSVARALLPAGGALRLNTIAHRIAWRPGEVTVHVRSAIDGATHALTARRLIVTVSLGVLQSGAIQFDPEPSDALEAARSLAFGQAMRVTLRFERVPEFLRPGFLLSEEPVFPTWWSASPEHAPIVTGWSAGPKADALLGQRREAIIARAVESLRRIAGGQLPAIAAAYFHDWHADPFFRGAYSYVPAGKLAARVTLATPVAETLYFAGEAANTTGHGATVHGAIESGRYAAQCAIAHASQYGRIPK